MDFNIFGEYFKYREDDDLVFLSHCTHDQLRPLVHYLTRDSDGALRFNETLTGNPKFKNNQNNYQVVWKEICTELQTFGNYTPLNILTRKGALYKEILFFTADAVGCSVGKDGDARAVEKEIVAKVMKLQMESMSQVERDDFIKIMHDIYKVSDVSPLKWSDRDYGLFSGILAGSSGMPAILGFSFLPRLFFLGSLFLNVLLEDGAALRVTLPCVIHIAMLREFHLHGNPFNEGDI